MKNKIIFTFIALLCLTTVLSLSLFIFGETEKTPTTEELKKKQNYVITGDESANRVFYNFADCEGVDATGETDMTELLQNFANENHNVFLPKGHYRIDGTVLIYSGYAITGEAGTVIHTSGNTLFQTSGASVDEIFVMAGNILLSNFSVESNVIPADASHPYILYASSVCNTTVEKIKAKNIGVAYFESVYWGLDENYHTHNVLVRDCEGDGGTIGKLDVYFGAYGVNLMNVTKFKVENCRFSNYLHGVQFMGGAGYYGSFQDLNSKRSCDGEIVGCVMDYMGGAGVWGDMSTNVNVYDCTVSHCTDVGIDFEASDDCEAIGNTAFDCANNFGTFHRICGHIEFRYNTSIQTKDSPYGSHFCHTNCTESPSVYTEIIFENNKFIAEKQSYIALTYYTMPFNNEFVFRNNECKNTFIIPSYINPDYPREYDELSFDIHKITISGNTFVYDDLDFTYKSAIYLALRPLKDGDEPDALIENNVINIANDNLNGITIYTPILTDGDVYKNEHGDHDDTLTAIIGSNKVTGGNIAFRIDNELDGLTADLTLENNIFDSAVFNGVVKYSFTDNRKNDGSELSEADVLIVSNLYTPDTKGKNGEIITTASKLPDSIGIALDGKPDIIWNGAESEMLMKKSGKSVKNAKLRTLWEDVEERIVLYLLVEVDKGEAINRRDAVRISFAALSGAKTANDIYIYEFNVAETVKSENLYCKYTIPETRTSETFELKLYIDKNSALYKEIIKDNKIGFNVEYAPNGKYENGIGWASASENVGAIGFGTLVFGSEPKQKLLTDALYGDVNGDGKIKGSDATLLLKYLAGWDVTIDETNADCNGDGTIKGKDSTLLLKYLAGWDVTLG